MFHILLMDLGGQPKKQWRLPPKRPKLLIIWIIDTILARKGRDRLSEMGDFLYKVFWCFWRSPFGLFSFPYFSKSTKGPTIHPGVCHSWGEEGLPNSCESPSSWSSSLSPPRQSSRSWWPGAWSERESSRSWSPGAWSERGSPGDAEDRGYQGVAERASKIVRSLSSMCSLQTNNWWCGVGDNDDDNNSNDDDQGTLFNLTFV